MTKLKRYPDGLKPSEETRKKQSKAHLGLKPSKETIEKRKMTITDKEKILQEEVLKSD